MEDFVTGLDPDIRLGLIRDLRHFWTHGSTGISGNPLSRDEIAATMDQGSSAIQRISTHYRQISPIAYYQEVVGHGRAIDLLLRMALPGRPFAEPDLFALQKALKIGAASATDEPVGVYKQEPNGTYILSHGESIFYEFAAPEDVPCLMEKWLEMLNRYNGTRLSCEDAVSAFAILHMAMVWIHPFSDGNGRLARLISNLPVLLSGYPPILIPRDRRKEYIRLLSEYKLASGSPDQSTCLLPENQQLSSFQLFCHDVWRITWQMVEAAHERQANRTGATCPAPPASHPAA
jgi:Fic family protein